MNRDTHNQTKQYARFRPLLIMFGIGAIVGLLAGGMNYLGELFWDQQWKAQEASRMANRITSEREWCESHNIDYWGSYCEKAWRKSQEYKVYQQWYVETWEPQYESDWRPKREFAGTVGRILTVVSVLLVAPGVVVWLSLGAVGGIILTIKKLQGRSWGIWVFLLGLIPIALWLIYLVIMMLVFFQSMNDGLGEAEQVSRHPHIQCYAETPKKQIVHQGASNGKEISRHIDSDGAAGVAGPHCAAER